MFSVLSISIVILIVINETPIIPCVRALDFQASLSSTFEGRLTSSIEVANATLSDLANEWQLSSFPMLLKSCYMTSAAYDALVLRFQKKVLLAETLLPQRFIISFTGSSVTAGHDSQFSQSFPVLVGALMKPAMSEANVELVSRNVGMGNTPCIPYDMVLTNNICTQLLSLSSSPSSSSSFSLSV